MPAVEKLMKLLKVVETGLSVVGLLGLLVCCTGGWSLIGVSLVGLFDVCSCGLRELDGSEARSA